MMFQHPQTRRMRRVTWFVLFSFFYLSVPIKANAASIDQPLTVLVLDVYSNSLSSSQIRSFSKAFREEVGKMKQFLVYSPTELQKTFSKNKGEENSLEEFDRTLSKAKKLYEESRFESAALLIQETIKKIPNFEATSNLLIKVNELYLTQGIVLSALNRTKEAEIAFLNATAFQPNRQLEPALYPPSIVGQYSKARENYSKFREGTLQIETTPTGAEVFIAEKKIGTTPLLLKNLPIGLQELKLTKKDFPTLKKKIAITANSSKNYPNRIEIDLNPNNLNHFVENLINEIAEYKTLDLQLEKMAKAGRLLSTDQVFAARIEKRIQNPNSYELFMVEVNPETGIVYKSYQKADSKLNDPNEMITRGLQVISAHKTPTTFTNLIAVKSENQKKPFYKKWYFYTLLGAAVAGGTGAAVLMSRGSSGPNISPYTNGVVGGPTRQP